MKYLFAISVLFFGSISMAGVHNTLQCVLDIQRFQNGKVVYADNQIVNGHIGTNAGAAAHVVITSSDKSLRFEGFENYLSGPNPDMTLVLFDTETGAAIANSNGIIMRGNHLEALYTTSAPTDLRVRFKCTDF